MPLILYILFEYLIHSNKRPLFSRNLSIKPSFFQTAFVLYSGDILSHDITIDASAKYCKGFFNFNHAIINAGISNNELKKKDHSKPNSVKLVT